MLFVVLLALRFDRNRSVINVGLIRERSLPFTRKSLRVTVHEMTRIPLTPTLTLSQSDFPNQPLLVLVSQSLCLGHRVTTIFFLE